MKLQLALDRVTRDESFKIVEETKEMVDWLEIGTSLIKEYGMSIVADMKEKYPEKIVVADMKTCDSGKYETEQAFENGADITTVMAFSEEKTILDALQVADQKKKRIMIDLLGIKNVSHINKLLKLGVNFIAFHHGKDKQSDNSFAVLNGFENLDNIKNVDIAIAGGINEGTLNPILKIHPDVVIVGGGITKSQNRYRSALKIKEMMQLYEDYNS